jgi:mono/diheme cytochrome c family protein
VYLAIADDAAIRGATESGRPGTSMPAFAKKAGGMLTDAQIEILVRGIRNWAKPVEGNPPAYASSGPGDPSRGHDVFAASCTSYHGKDGRGPRAIAIRPIVAGHRSALAHGDYHGMPPLACPIAQSNKPLSDIDVTDLVAWLSSQREALSTVES